MEKDRAYKTYCKISAKATAKYQGVERQAAKKRDEAIAKANKTFWETTKQAVMYYHEIIERAWKDYQEAKGG